MGELRKIPGVGKQTEQDLWLLGSRPLRHLKMPPHRKCMTGNARYADKNRPLSAVYLSLRGVLCGLPFYMKIRIWPSGCFRAYSLNNQPRYT